RRHMLELAATGEPRFVVDDRELRRDGPSYTVDTLVSLANAYPDAHLALLLGSDSFATLPSWGRWQELADHAHLVVMARPDPGRPWPDELHTWLSRRETESWDTLRSERCGRVLFQSVTPLGVSATAVRERLAAGRSGRYLLPDAVWDYIHAQGLYGAGTHAGGERR
ncbi:MAG: nicotinate-nucleotide adenylyltransferase, partial [Ectothiorhodospiraceae bacterium]